MKKILFILFSSLLFTIFTGCNVEDEVNKIVNSSSSSSSAISSDSAVSSSSNSSSSGRSYTFDDWSLSCPNGLEYRIDTPSAEEEYHRCIVSEDEFYNLKFITNYITSGPTTEYVYYYLVLPTNIQTRSNSYESKLIRVTHTDANNILRADNYFSVFLNEGTTNEYWISRNKHLNAWWDNGLKATEQIFESRLDSDGVYRAAMLKNRTWHYDKDLLADEWTFEYKQHANGDWSALNMLHEQWYYSGNQTIRRTYIVKQNSDGLWNAHSEHYTWWYDSDIMRESTSYDHVLYNGRWYQYIQEQKAWCEDGKLSADFTGTYTTDNGFDSHLTGPNYGCG